MQYYLMMGVWNILRLICSSWKWNLTVSQIQRNGQKVDWNTRPIIWGEVGPNAQHAFYQLLHQGSQAVSCDFIAPVQRYKAQQFTYVDNARGAGGTASFGLIQLLGAIAFAGIW